MVSRVRTPLLVKGAIEPKNISFDLKQTLVTSAYEQLEADNYSCFSFRGLVGLDWIGWVGMVGWFAEEEGMGEGVSVKVPGRSDPMGRETKARVSRGWRKDGVEGKGRMRG